MAIFVGFLILKAVWVARGTYFNIGRQYFAQFGSTPRGMGY